MDLKKILNTLIIIIQALIKSKTPSIRQITDILPIKANKQSKVNRIWRFINKSKLFKPKHIYQVITKIVFKLTKQNKIIIDFTSLEAWNIKLLIISVPFISRSLPIYAKTLFLSDIYNMKYKSENEFIKKIHFRVYRNITRRFKRDLIIFADKQFATKEFIKFFIENNLRFVIRIKEKVKVEIDGEEILIKNLTEEKVNKYLVLFILSHLFGILI